MSVIIPKEKIEQILAAAVTAPSGDNSQPWRFVFRVPNMLDFYAIPEKDNTLLNVDNSGTYIALGAALQNAELEAKALGFNPKTQYANEGTLIATLTLDDDGKLSDTEQVLHRAIPLRHTNRKAYKKVLLTQSDRQILLDAAKGSPGVSFSLVEDSETMSRISRALTTMEEIALACEPVHKLFFGSIFWSEERNRTGEHGLYIKTLELPPPAELFFRVLRYWPVARFLARIGFPKMVAETNAKQNASASAFGVITIDRFERARYIEAGRLLERVWLAAAARGLSLQIVTGLLFLARTAERKDAPFSAQERAMAQKAYVKIRENLTDKKEPFLTFRVGYAETPSAVSFRQAAAVTYAH